MSLRVTFLLDLRWRRVGCSRKKTEERLGIVGKVKSEERKGQSQIERMKTSKRSVNEKLPRQNEEEREAGEEGEEVNPRGNRFPIYSEQLTKCGEGEGFGQQWRCSVAWRLLGAHEVENGETRATGTGLRRCQRVPRPRCQLEDGSLC